MNLEYAAYLLNENTILTEDADGSGQNGAKAWLRANMPNTEFGSTGEGEVENPETLKIMAMSIFGHPLNADHPNDNRLRRKGTYKFLPGAVRIAVTDCGWLTEHEDTKMMENLVAMYAAAFYEWQDGIAAGLHGASPRDPYPGKYNKDFNGLTYAGLYRELGSKIPETKERLAALRNGTEATEEEAARAAREAEEREQERIRNSTAGEYHIEFIPNFAESKKWYKYTNPQTTSAGCHWCLTQGSEHWNSYWRSNRSIYFCWKAPSKEALLEMNDHFGDYYRRGEDDIMEAPFNEYGLSMICIIVQDDGSGEPKFVQATSRYNHYGPEGHWIDDAPYGDKLVPNNRSGFTKILNILGITADEFKQKFPVRSDSGDDSHDHTIIGQTLSEIRNANDRTSGREAIARKLRDICSDMDFDDYDTYGIIRINHARQVNFIDSNYNLLSPTRWFDMYDGEFNNGAVAVRFKDEHNRNVWNLIKSNGEFMLAKNVDGIKIEPTAKKYARFKVVIGEEELYNIVNLTNGNILLRKPVHFVKLCPSYFGSIPVIEKRDDSWTLVDLKGKSKSLPGGISGWDIETADDSYNDSGKYLMAVQFDGGKYGIVNLQKNKVIYRAPTDREVVYSIKEKYFVICDRVSEKYSLFDDTGNKLISNIDRSFRFDTAGTVAWYPIAAYPHVKVYDLKENRYIDIPAAANYNNVDFYKNAMLVGRDKLYIDGELVVDGGDFNDRRIYPLAKPFDNMIWLVSKQQIYDIKNKNVVANYVRKLTHSANYPYFCAMCSNGIETYDTDGNLIEEIQGAVDAKLMNFNCMLIEFADDTYNILNSDGKKMFKLNFKELRSSSFNDNGVAEIVCGRNTYYINTEGDVSRALELISENRRVKYEPMLMEYSAPRRTWIDHAARFLG